MICHPKPGTRVRLRYRKQLVTAGMAPHHDQTGRVVLPAKRRPLNHVVEMESGELVNVPCGYLMKEE